MLQNRNYQLLLITLVMAIFSACNKPKVEPETNNYLQLSVQGSSDGSVSITNDNTTPIQFDVLLAYTPKEDVTLNFVLVGNDNNLLRLEGCPLTLKAGTKTGSFKVAINKADVITETQTVTLKAGEFSNPHIVLQKEWSIHVKPNVELPDLTEQQKQFIKGYKENLGIDLYRVLGKLKGHVTIKFPSGDEAFNGNSLTGRTFDFTSFVTLSNNATATDPIIKMVTNPLGLDDFLFETLRKETTEDVNEAWYAQPYPIAIMKLLGYTPTSKGIFDVTSKETFNAMLDNLKLDNGKIAFIGKKLPSTSSDESDAIMAVPFEYNYSLWNKLAKMDPNTVVEVIEGDAKTGYALKDILLSGGSLAPQDYLFTSNIDKDEFNNNTFIAPKAIYDFSKGEISFQFGFDHTNSSGYTQIFVTYQMHPAK